MINRTKKGKGLVVFVLLSAFFLIIMLSNVASAAELSNDLQVWFKLDEISGTIVKNSINGSWNGTNINSILNQGGVIGTSYFFDNAANSYVTFNGNKDFENFSISFWVKPSVMIKKYVVYKYGQMQVDFNPTEGNIRFEVWVGSGCALYSRNVFPLNEWTHVVVNNNPYTGERNIYINGILNATASGGGCMIGLGNGNWGLSTNEWGLTGNIDEYGLWSKMLSASEVSQLYNNGSGITYPFITDALPIVSLNSPEDDADLAPPVTFNCSAIDDNGLLNLSLWINGEKKETITNDSANQKNLELIYEIDNLSLGDYNWNCKAYDNKPQESWAESNKTFSIVDLSIPRIAIINIIPSQPKSNQNLGCYATLVNGQQTNITANWWWYKNGVKQLSGSKNVLNNTYTLIKSVNAGNISKGENWSCVIQPYDNYYYGENATAEVLILNSAPTQNKPLLTTPSKKNLSTENLTCQNTSTNDADGDTITNIFNWFKNSQPLMALNLAFEINANDYSGNNNNGNISGDPQFVIEKYGRAYDFDGDDYITISDSDSLDFSNKKTWQLWFKRATTGAETLFDKGDGTQSNYKLEFLSDNTLKFLYSIQAGLINYLWQVYDETDFDEGNYNQTDYNETYSAVMLNNQYAGDYKSKVFSNSDKTLSLSTLSWSADVPITEELNPEEGMVGLWHLNEQSANSAPGGADIEDFSGNNNHGNEFGGVTFNASGKLDSALSFDGVNDYVSLENTYGFEKNDNMAFEFWIKTTSGNNGAIASKMDNSAPYRGWQVFYYGTGKIGFFLRSDDSPANALIIETNTATVNSGNWHHVAITYDGTSNASGAKIYIDGNFEAITILDNTLSDTIQNTKISQISGRDGGNVLFTGSIDEFAIYNKSLSANEILEDYNRGIGAITNLSLSARSCDDSACSGESWTITDLTSSPADISSLSDNKYFQFKADFITNNTQYSPKLYNVTLDYSAQTTGNEANITSSSAITDTNWHLATITFDNSISENNFKIYLDNSLETQKTEHTLPYYKANDLTIAKYFNGSIDEFKIYQEALTAEQITNNFNLNYNKIVSQETSGGDNYMCQITTNDGEEDGATNSSTNLNVLWGIMFNVTSGEDNSQLNNFNINCNNSWSISGADSFEEFGFEPGSYECTFEKENFYDKIKIVSADYDKTIKITLSKIGALTTEEHTWLEALYNCIILKDCDLYNLLLEINETTGNIWEYTKPIDQSIVTNREITNRVVDSTHNLTIDYTVNIPIKAGYSLGTYLPVRIGYWFLNSANTTCYNQGTKPIGVDDPYCQPLVIETLGPMGGSVSFTTELQPSLPAGEYSIKEMIDIDPNNVWINYGQDIVGTILVTEFIDDYGIAIDKTREQIPNRGSSTSESNTNANSGSNSEKKTTIRETEIIKLIPQENEDKNKEAISLGKPKVTGATIGILTNGNVMFVIIILCITFIIVLVITSRAIVKVSENSNIKKK